MPPATRAGKHAEADPAAVDNLKRYKLPAVKSFSTSEKKDY